MDNRDGKNSFFRFLLMSMLFGKKFALFSLLMKSDARGTIISIFKILLVVLICSLLFVWCGK